MEGECASGFSRQGGNGGQWFPMVVLLSSVAQPCSEQAVDLFQQACGVSCSARRGLGAKMVVDSCTGVFSGGKIGVVYVVMVCYVWLDVGIEVDSERIVKGEIFFFWWERRVEGDGCENKESFPKVFFF